MTVVDRLAEAKQTAAYWRADMHLHLLDGIEQAMEDSGMTRAELARSMGWAPSQVSRLMADDIEDEPNVTLNTVARLALAVGLRPQLRLTEPAEGVVAQGVGVMLGRSPVPESSGLPAVRSSEAVALAGKGAWRPAVDASGRATLGADSSRPNAEFQAA